MTDKPSVSVVMAVHNRADYLPEALASIRWQTHDDWECVCVDDGSTDATPEVLARFAAADPRIRVLRQEKAGITAALTRGDAAARADLIARMDSDDVAFPRRLELQLAHLRAHPECVGVGAQVLLVDPEGEPIGPAPHALEHDEIERRLLHARGGTIAHPTLMFRKEVAERIGGHRAEFEWAHDADLLVRLAHAGRLANLPETLLLYRQHPKNSCRVHHVEVRRHVLGSVSDAHAARGQETPAEVVAALSGVSRQSSLTGKWARQAARNGHLRTARRLYAQMLRNEGLSWHAARVGAEAMLRAAVALASGKRGEPIDLPDWRRWDASQGAERAAA